LSENIYQGSKDTDMNKSPAQPSLEMFQAVLDALPFCVFWKDLDSVGLGCNQALAKVAGLSTPKDYIGKTDYDLPWTEEEADFFRECDRRVMTSGIAELDIIESQQQADGKIAWLETSKIPLEDDFGNVVGILGAFHDITERKRIEDENIANQKLDSLSTLAAGLAHDFNNILSMILGSSQVARIKIANGSDEAEVVKYLDRIEKAIERASKLTEKFMNYSERGEVTKTIFNHSQMLEEVISFVQPSIKSPIKHETNDVDSMLYADVNQINQVINNILINASHASTNNEEIVVNVCRCKIQQNDKLNLTSGNYIAISITDHGIGMSLEQQESIFTPYFTTKTQGHGLGLSSCISIIKNHNGDIQVESKEGLGSTFTIYLPISLQDKKDMLHQAFSNDLILGSGRILYIEDDLDTQAATLDMLQALGYQVTSFTNVELGTAYIKEHSELFDIVITDFMIGESKQGGNDILNCVREVRPDCPVLLITGYFKQLQTQQKNNKFSYIAQKPVSFEKISQILDRLSHQNS